MSGPSSNDSGNGAGGDSGNGSGSGSANGSGERPPGGAPPEPSDLADLKGLLAGRVRVLRYPHETEPDEDGGTTEWHCDVVVSDDVPAPGFTSYATVGLREFETNVSAADGRRVRTELVTVSRRDYPQMADVLDACALAISSGSFHVQPGIVLPNAVSLIDKARRCEHMFLVPPFLWPELEVVEEGDEQVLTRLQVVPVTTSEMSYAAKNGHQALFDALDSSGADVSNPDRAPVL